MLQRTWQDVGRLHTSTAPLYRGDLSICECGDPWGTPEPVFCRHQRRAVLGKKKNQERSQREICSHIPSAQIHNRHPTRATQEGAYTPGPQQAHRPEPTGAEGTGTRPSEKEGGADPTQTSGSHTDQRPRALDGGGVHSTARKRNLTRVWRQKTWEHTCP